MTTQEKVRIGFVGVGSMGQCAHLKNYVTVDGCEVVAIAELREGLGRRVAARYGVPEASIREMSEIMGISGVCNVLACIKAAKFYGLRSGDNMFTIATDTIDRYHSVMRQLDEAYGTMDETEAAVRLVSIFHGAATDWLLEGTQHAKQCWFNLKYYTWVEQQAKDPDELDAQWQPEYWEAVQALVPQIDELIEAFNEQTGLSP